MPKIINVPILFSPIIFVIVTFVFIIFILAVFILGKDETHDQEQEGNTATKQVHQPRRIG